MKTKIVSGGSPPNGEQWNPAIGERNVRLMQWLRIFGASFAADMPVLVLLFQENGLSMTEVMLLQALFAAALAAFEVPSGYFADLVSRRAALVLAGFGLVIGAGLYVIAQSFWGFLVAELFLAFALAFSSGADQALFHDSLLANKREGESTVLWGRIGFYTFIAMAVAAVAGGLLGSWSLRAPLVLTLLGTIAYLVIALQLTEPPRDKQGGGCNSVGLKDLLSVAVQCLLRDPQLRWLLLSPALLGALLQVGLWLYQPYFKLTEIPVVYFGFLFAAFNVTAAISSKFAAKLGARWSPVALLVGPLLVVAGSYLLMGTVVGLFSFAFILMQQFVRGFTFVYFSDALNKGIGSERRATILSLQSMLTRLVYAAMLVPFGVVADGFGVTITFVSLGAAAVLLGAVMVATLRPVSPARESEATG